VRRKKKNIILEKLLVEDYAAGGKSLAKVDGKVIFIENVVPGDVVDVRLMKPSIIEIRLNILLATKDIY